jgi:hypothetical protein
MAEMGHTDPALALSLYAQAMRRDESEQAQLRAQSRALIGPTWANGTLRPLRLLRSRRRKVPILQAMRP